jgi:DNA-directed RNA polymerase subunit F
LSHRISTEEPIPLAEVEKRLKQREEAAPLNYIQRITLDHAHRFSDQRAGKDLIDMLMETFKLERLVAVQLVNLCPRTLIDITAILGETVDEAKRQKILDFYTEHVASQPEEVIEEEDELEEELDEEFDEEDEEEPEEEEDMW